jgi:hypothetical protein
MKTLKEQYFRGLVTMEELIEEEPEQAEQEWFVEEQVQWFELRQAEYDRIREYNQKCFEYGWYDLVTKPS